MQELVSYAGVAVCGCFLVFSVPLVVVCSRLFVVCGRLLVVCGCLRVVYSRLLVVFGRLWSLPVLKIMSLNTNVRK